MKNEKIIALLKICAINLTKNSIAELIKLCIGLAPARMNIFFVKVGRRIRERGWPTPEEAITPESWLAPKKGDNTAAAG